MRKREKERDMENDAYSVSEKLHVFSLRDNEKIVSMLLYIDNF